CETWSRRQFMGGLTLAGSAALLGGRAEPVAAEPPPETPRIRLPRYPWDVACTAPQWVAEELLKAEGFSTVEYVKTTKPIDLLGAGDIDLIIADAPWLILGLDAGKPVVSLGCVHGGCYVLFGSDRVRSVHDLKGKTVGVANPGRRAFVASMA